MAQTTLDPDLLVGELEKLPLQTPEKLSAKACKDLKWKLYKEEIRQMYVDQGSTLNQIMMAIQEKHGFKARYYLFLGCSNSINSLTVV